MHFLEYFISSCSITSHCKLQWSGDTSARDEVLEKMHEESVRRDMYVDKEVDKHQERLARHQHDLEVLWGKVSKLE